VLAIAIAVLAIPLAVLAGRYLVSIVLLYLLQQIVVGKVSAIEPKLEGLGKRLLGPLLGPPVGSSTRQKGELGVDILKPFSSSSLTTRTSKLERFYPGKHFMPSLTFASTAGA
jgi:hypothetical protein